MSARNGSAAAPAALDLSVYRWRIYQATPGAWVASPPLNTSLHVETFSTFREAVDHYIRHQRAIAATRLARLLAGVTT